MSGTPTTAGGQTLGGGGRPDERFPAPTIVAPGAGRESAGLQTVPVSIVATANLSRKQGQIRFVNPLPNGRESGLDPDSQVTLRALGATGAVLREYPVCVNLYSELTADQDREGLVDAVVVVGADIRAITLAIGGQVVDSVRVGGALPPLRGAQPIVSDDTFLRIGLALERAMEDGQSYAVQVSTDQGVTWQTVGVGLREPVVAIDRGQFQKGATLLVRVLATNGLDSVIATTEPLRV